MITTQSLVRRTLDPAAAALWGFRVRSFSVLGPDKAVVECMDADGLTATGTMAPSVAAEYVARCGVVTYEELEAA